MIDCSFLVSLQLGGVVIPNPGKREAEGSYPQSDRSRSHKCVAANNSRYRSRLNERRTIQFIVGANSSDLVLASVATIECDCCLGYSKSCLEPSAERVRGAVKLYSIHSDEFQKNSRKKIYSFRLRWQCL